MTGRLRVLRQIRQASGGERDHHIDGNHALQQVTR